MRRRTLSALAALPLLAIAHPAAAQIDFGARAIAAQKTTAPDSRPTLYNVSPAMLLRWRLALARASTGTGRAKLVVLGDNTSDGGGAGGGTYGMDGARVKSWPILLKGLMTGVAVRDENAFGDSGVPMAGTAGVTVWDPRLSFAGSSWTRAVDSLGGAMFTAASGSDAITFAPATAVDSCDIWYVQQPGQGSFTVSDGSGTLATVNTANAVTAFTKATATRTASTSPISLKLSAAGTLYISGIDCYNSAAPAVSIYNFSTYGTTAQGKAATANPWQTANALAAFAPDLTIIDLGINDQRAGRTAAQYVADIQTLIAKAKLSGDVILVWHHPDGATVGSALTQAYRTGLLGLARAAGVPMVDLGERFVSRSAASAFYFDDVHLLAAGYQDIARAILPLVQP